MKKRFRRKPTEIEAEQWFPGFAGNDIPEGVCYCVLGQESTFGGGSRPHLHTAHAGQVVLLEAGDWIVPEPDRPGRFYPIKPDVMEKYFDLLDHG